MEKVLKFDFLDKNCNEKKPYNFGKKKWFLDCVALTGAFAGKL